MSAEDIVAIRRAVRQARDALDRIGRGDDLPPTTAEQCIAAGVTPEMVKPILFDVLIGDDADAVIFRRASTVAVLRAGRRTLIARRA